MKYYSYAGYVGAISVLIATFTSIFFKFDLHFSISRTQLLFSIITFTFFMMLIYEFFNRYQFHKKDKSSFIQKSNFDNIYIFKSSIFRFIALLVPISLLYYIVQGHYYFTTNYFSITREFFNYFLGLYLILGLPYLFFTLKYRAGIKQEFNDYAILLIISYKNFLSLLYGVFLNKKEFKNRGKKFLGNKRIKKVYLVYLVNFFFLTLMVTFFNNEFNQVYNAFNNITSSSFDNKTFFKQYHGVYLLLYHSLFVVDVAIALIGYTIASRWLDNRTKSVDMTLGGWMVALMCYPPLNGGFTDRFIGYGYVSTHNIVSSEIILMILMAFILLLFTVYVWATLALGFKFSNLTNRGIVDRGPYAYIRHPAYATKNLAWWLDNTFVLSNFWAALALGAWNIVYILRGLTEERHLKKDKEYEDYCKKVKYRFIPKII